MSEHMHRGQRVYDPHTGRYVGRYLGPLGSAKARIAPEPKPGQSEWTTPEKVVRRDEIGAK